MFRHLRTQLTRRKTDPRCVPPSPPPAEPANYRLVGYATMPDGDRLRLYVDRQAAATAVTPVYAQTTPGRFDYSGQPLGLRTAPDELAQSVRARILGQPADNDLRGAEFRPAA